MDPQKKRQPQAIRLHSVIVTRSADGSRGGLGRDVNKEKRDRYPLQRAPLFPWLKAGTFVFDGQPEISAEYATPVDAMLLFPGQGRKRLPQREISKDAYSGALDGFTLHHILVTLSCQLRDLSIFLPP